MRLPGRRSEAAAQRPMQFPPTIICPVCGLRNDISVRFCRNCGLPLGAPRDPVRGTTTKRADLPSDRGTGIAAIIGLLIVVGIVGGAGFLIYKGFQGNGETAVATPSPTRAPRTSAAPATPPIVSFPAGSVGPVESPGPAPHHPSHPTHPRRPTNPQHPTPQAPVLRRHPRPSARCRRGPARRAPSPTRWMAGGAYPGRAGTAVRPPTG